MSPGWLQFIQYVVNDFTLICFVIVRYHIHMSIDICSNKSVIWLFVHVKGGKFASLKSVCFLRSRYNTLSVTYVINIVHLIIA